VVVVAAVKAVDVVVEEEEEEEGAEEEPTGAENGEGVAEDGPEPRLGQVRQRVAQHAAHVRVAVAVQQLGRRRRLLLQTPVRGPDLTYEVRNRSGRQSMSMLWLMMSMIMTDGRKERSPSCFLLLRLLVAPAGVLVVYVSGSDFSPGRWEMILPSP